LNVISPMSYFTVFVLLVFAVLVFAGLSGGFVPKKPP
jgi:hypothetical protein